MILSGLVVSALLNYHYKHTVGCDKQQKELRKDLIALDLLDPDTGLVTEKGAVFIDMLIQTPLPVSGQAWLDPRVGD